MTAMSSARSAVRPKQTTATAATLIPPLANLDPNVISRPLQAHPPKPPLILLMSKRH